MRCCLKESFEKYPSGSIGRVIAYIKYLDRKDLRGSRPGTNLSTVPICHAIGDDPHIGDVKQYQNNIRSFINKGGK
ncbi:MAG: hypothetical protein IJM75_04900 [Ruminococcus sp.]|nr:hypothetical protein [Ruminococcus sp.]